jgi:thiamine-phosphate diphosphorylase
VHSASDLDSGRALLETGSGGWNSLDMVQVRGKSMPAADLERLVALWRDAVSGSPTLVVVNDRLDVALATGAHGVHVGRNDLPVDAVHRLAPHGFVIGVSAHDERELALARESGASYAGLGAFYGSRTKPEAVLLERDRQGLGEAIRQAAIPILAIGGITAGRVHDVFSSAPVSGIAVSHAIQGAADPAAATLELRAEVDRTWMAREPHTVQG